MPCEVCGEALVTGIEQKLRACAGCLAKSLETAASLKEENLKLQVEAESNLQKLEAAKAALEELEGYRRAEKEGGAAQSRGASLDDNPYDQDSDMSACWSYGWLFSDISSSVARMQSVMLFAANMLSVIKDVAAGGASGDEVAAKLGTVIDKLAPYIYEDEAPVAG